MGSRTKRGKCALDMIEERTCALFDPFLGLPMSTAPASWFREQTPPAHAGREICFAEY